MAVPAASVPGLRAASLFDVDSELAEHLDARRRNEFRAHAIVPVVDIPAGPWTPAPLAEALARPFGVMVVDGLALREIVLAGSTSAELLGPCDLLAVAAPDEALLGTGVHWTVPQAASIVALDDRIMRVLRAWPAVSRLLLERAARRETRLATHRAIAQLPRVDLRLLAFFGHLSERWGRVASSGVVMPLQLTHETLGRLIGARRPTVSLGLKDLAAQGLLQRRNDGSWLLSYEAFERLGADGAVSGWQPADARLVETALTAPTAAEEKPAVAHGFSPPSAAALRARIARLQAEHEARLSRYATSLARSRAIREGIRLDRDDRAA
jgi:CRP/FNR family cyclic AMP-dependent transcriptional regulator